jgi:DNA-directed RNA polymerase subunit RPC12/RpoP
MRKLTLGGFDSMAKIPCFLCSSELRQRKDKNRKPYFVCDPCGVQIFVRGRQGIENLAQLIETLKERDFPFREHAQTLHEIQAILTEIRGIKKEIKSLDSVLDIFREDEDKKRTRALLEKRIEKLLGCLDLIARDRK